MATPPVECKACLTTAHAADVRRIQYPRATPERQAVREEYILTRRAACSEYLHPVFCSFTLLHRGAAFVSELSAYSVQRFALRQRVTIQ